MNNKEIIKFFDSLAPEWDKNTIKSDEIIDKILKGTKIAAGQNVLDVACGTGVMFDYYISHNVASVTGIDISPEMIKIAKEKYKDESKIEVVCDDVLTAKFNKKFDLIVVYNAFPHFPDPEALIKKLASLLKTGGLLTIAHGASREEINACHEGAASKVSLGLMSETDLAKLFEPYLKVETMISNDTMYQVSGVLL